MTVTAGHWMARVHQPWGLTAWEAAGLLALTAAAATYLFGSVASLALLGWAGYLVLASARPALALPLVVIAIPFSWVEKNLPQMPFSPTEFVLFNTLVAGAVGLALRGEAQTFLRQGLRGSFELPAILFLIAGFVASFVAEVREPAAREFRLVVAEPVLFFFVVTHAIQNPRQLWWLVDALAATALVTALIALVQYFFPEGVVAAEGVARARALYPSPNNLGLFLGRVLPILAALALLGTRARPFYGLAAALGLVTVVLTYSYGAWLGLAMAGLTITLVAWGWRVVAGATVATGIVAAALAFIGPGRFLSHLSLQEGTTAERLLVWRGAWDMLRDHPLFGVGLDNFLYQYERYRLPEAWREPALSHPHNFLLDFWLRMGIIGPILFGWLVVAFFGRTLKLWRSLADPTQRALALGLVASMVDTLAHGMVDNSYFLIDLALLFWLTLALAQLLERFAAEPA